MRTAIRASGGLISGDSLQEATVVIENGRVAAVTSEAPPGVPVDEVEGFLMGGLRDAHTHPGAMAASTAMLDLQDVTNMSELRGLIEERASRIGPGRPILGTNLDDEAIGRLPDRTDIDLESNPVMIYRKCGHIAVASTRTLELAGVDGATPDPAGGSFDRSPHPTGVLREKAIDRVASALQPALETPPPEMLLESLSNLARRGITEIDAMVGTGASLWCGVANEFEALLEVASDIPINVRVFLMTDSAEQLLEGMKRLEDGHMIFGGWKGFADGSFGGHTALLEEPYDDKPETVGVDRFEQKSFERMASIAIEAGGLAVHAIGDRATAKVLDFYAKFGGVEAPLRIEHASLLNEGLIRRMRDQGVIASVQPQFAVSDEPWLVKRLGEDRAQRAYRFDRLEGVELRIGSDAPIETPDPWLSLAAAVTHTGLKIENALAATTPHDPTPGSPADLVLVDRNPLESSPRQLATTRVDGVWVAGERIV